MAIQGLGRRSWDNLLLGDEYLIAEEISTSEDYADCKDCDVGGGRDGHCEGRTRTRRAYEQKAEAE